MADTLQLHLKSEAEAYEKLSPLIWKTCVAFQRKFGGELDDLFGEAALAFLKAHRTFTPPPEEEGKNFHLGGWLQRLVWQQLIRYSQHSAKHGVTGNIRDNDEANWNPLEELSDLVEHTMEWLSEDAQQLVRLILNHDGELSRGKKARKRLTELLLELGWTGQRIIASFQEIRDVLLG